MSIPTVAAAVADLLALSRDAVGPPDAADAGAVRESPETERLIARARQGDHAAFGNLVAQNERAVYRTALAALGRPEDAEDVAQESFVVAWRKLRSFRGEATFRTWLLTITWRKALDRRRLRLRWWKRFGSATESEDGTGRRLAGHEADPERAALASDRARRVRAEILRLSPTLRDTLLLAASGEHTYGEIAGMLGVPVGTVKWRVAEARRRITERLPHDR